jgi:hypothetical protein
MPECLNRAVHGEKTSIIPFGDMANILASGGSKTTALSVHGVTCAAMLSAGLRLVHAI